MKVAIIGSNKAQGRSIAQALVAGNIKSELIIVNNKPEAFDKNYQAMKIKNFGEQTSYDLTRINKTLKTYNKHPL